MRNWTIADYMAIFVAVFLLLCFFCIPCFATNIGCNHKPQIVNPVYICPECLIENQEQRVTREIVVLRRIGDVFIEVKETPLVGHFGTDGKELLMYIDEWKKVNIGVIKSKLSIYEIIK